MTARARGFTLLEVLVVLIVGGLVLALLSQGVFSGVRGVRTWRTAVEPRDDVAVAEHFLLGIVERMDPGVWPDPPEITGSATTLNFVTDLPDPATGGTMAADVRLEVANTTLRLLWRARGGGIPFQAPPPYHQTALLTGVRGLELSYAADKDGISWLSAWNEKALPRLVRVRLEMENGGPVWPAIVMRPRREQAQP